MPTYEYRCKDCEHRFDIQQSFTDDSLTTCPECGGTLKKVFGNVGITFKGSGFYKTDSRSGSTSGGGSSSSDGGTSTTEKKPAETSTSSSSSEGSSSTKADSSSSGSGSGSTSSSSAPATTAS